LRDAYFSGVVLAGISAGANCWFEQCSTDSIPGPYTMMRCLGLLSGSFCPHYNGEPLRRPSYLEMVDSGAMLPGYAADDGAAIHMVNEVPFLCVGSRPSSLVYRVSPGSEVALSTQYLKS
jgi:dipeptidase E